MLSVRNAKLLVLSALFLGIGTPLSPHAKPINVSLDDLLSNAEVVCLCRIDNVRAAGSRDVDGSEQKLARLTALVVFKGSAATELLFTPASSASVDLAPGTLGFFFLRKRSKHFESVAGYRSVLPIDSSGVVQSGVVIGQPRDLQAWQFAAKLVR